MANDSGLYGQIGFVDEVTPGTAVTVTRFMRFVTESIENDSPPIEGPGIVAGRRVLDDNQLEVGNQDIGGSFEVPVTDNTIGLLLKHLFGTVGTTGAGPYVHTFTPGDKTSQAFTAQIGRPGSAGTVHPFTFAGCKLLSGQFKGAAGQVLTATFETVAMTETTGTALATASFGSADNYLNYLHGDIQIASADPGVVSGFTLDITDSMKTDRRTAGSATIKEPLQNGLLTVAGSLDLEFKDLTQYTRYLAKTQVALTLIFTRGANSLAFTLNVVLGKNTAPVQGPDVLTSSAPFTALGSTDAAACTAVLTNDDSTP